MNTYDREPDPYEDPSEGQSSSALALDDQMLREQYMGGQEDQSAVVGALPERVDWDKKLGHWSSESGGDGLLEMGGRLIACVTVWAVWSGTVGKPLCIDVGKACSERGGHQMGLRVIFADDNDDLFVWDAFGLSFKAAQSAVRRSRNTNGRFLFSSRRQVQTDNGPFYTPALERVDEGVKDGK